ncbi:hypothetical protein GCM10010156_08000 [Planobispora rosea]|uniref:EcsC protein family protein n=1 Tax=Planobispora rosea TaxID=35762 RepID=A0A8J3RX76_PLARO|nr:hypothetical protein [Planobispora rosea]GGS51750.1 hypothetical protein GCM10010156_08000 [Planobispora rosea]GIH82965.1 hypothetical protein Pro02_13730 [Planobispora rosea]
MTSENRQTGATPDDSPAAGSAGVPEGTPAAISGDASDGDPTPVTGREAAAQEVTPRTAAQETTSGPAARETAPETAGPGDGDEVAELVGRLAEPGEMDGAERRRLLGRLTKALAAGAKKAKESGTGRGRWLADVFMAVAPRIPVRDLATLSAHHHGLTGEALADDLARTAAKATMTVGAIGGALAAAEFAAPPLLLSAPAQLVAETLVVSAIEVKLIAELHEVYGVEVPGTGAQRAIAFVTAWSKQRGVDPAAPGSVTVALGTAAKTALRNRLMRTLGRHLTTLGPFLTGAVAGGTLNRAATRKLADVVRDDLRQQRSLPPATAGKS